MGYGGVLKDQWFWGEWPPTWRSYSITLLELYPIVLALHLWGHQLQNKRIVIHTDTQALAFILNKFSSKHKDIMLIRHLALYCLK